jgi:muramoyltetrapeptide carboxypeptidase
VPVIKPPRLRNGDLIGLVSPAGGARPREKIELGARYLEGLGYRVAVGANAAKEFGYLAGTDAERLDDLNAMIRDPRVKAIFALRGGYGSGRLLRSVDYEGLRRAPKIFSGFSDITALLMAIYRQCKLVTFSGPMPAVEFWQKMDPYTEENFWRMLTTAEDPGELRNPADSPMRCLRGGTATGPLLGGNLALFTSLLGTEFCPSFRNAILALEDVDEPPYRVDRMLTHLRNTRFQPKGAVFGKFTLCAPKKEPSLSLDQVQTDFADQLRIPALAELQYGHVPKKLTLPFGARARLNAGRRTLEILESVVE